MAVEVNSDTQPPVFDGIDCEYQLLVDLSKAQSIESLDLTLERVFRMIFGADKVQVLNPIDSRSHSTLSESEQHVYISSLENLIRDVVIDGSSSSPQRRFLDAALEVYINHYELLVKSQVDKLTGLFNRQVLEEKVGRLTVSRELADRRKNEPMRVIALFDIDHFKKINDNYGHLYGDEVLVLLSHIMKTAFRSDDWLFRYGGEEFLVFLNNINIDQAKSIINRFLQRVVAHHFPQIGTVTISCGYTEYDSQEDFPTIIDRADKALYFSKEHGRNQAHLYEDLVLSGEIESTERGGDVDYF